MREGGIALVTGASGFVGSHLVERLIQSGVTVRCFLRGSSSTKWLPTSDLVQVNRGSLHDVAALEEQVRGADTVYHLAAITSSPTRDEYFRSNVEATATLVEAMRRAAPDAALVFCSSQSAAGPSLEGRPRRESDTERPITPYGESKLAAERVVLGSGLRATVLRPSAVYGPRDRDILEMFTWAARGLSPVVGAAEQRLSMVHVSDLVTGLVAAAGAGVTGTFFVSDGEFHDRSELLRQISLAVGRRTTRQLRVPMVAAVTLAHASSLFARVAGSKPLLTPQRIAELANADWTCDDSRARAELGYQSSIIMSEGLADTARWYREQGWI